MGNWQPIARRIRVPLGFLFAAIYIWLSHPTWRAIGIGACFVVAGLLVRALASGYVRKNEELTTTGPYAYTRNPLYLGSLVLSAGFLIAARSWILAVAAAGLFFVIYLPVIRSEENFLRSRFPQFDEYCRNVPRLFPRIPPSRSSATSFSAHLYWKHREYNALAGSAALFAALVVKVLWFSK